VRLFLKGLNPHSTYPPGCNFLGQKTSKELEIKNRDKKEKKNNEE